MYTPCSPFSSPQCYLLTLLTCLSRKNQKQRYTSKKIGKKIEYKQIKYNHFGHMHRFKKRKKRNVINLKNSKKLSVFQINGINLK